MDAVDKGPIHEMRSQYMPKILIESAHMKTENKIRKIDQDLKFVSEVCKKLDHRIDGLKEIYCKRTDFDKEIGQFTAQKDFADVKNKMQFFAKESDVMKIVGELKARHDTLRQRMEKNFATKNEIREETNKLSSAIGNHYMSVANFSDFRDRQEKKNTETRETIEVTRNSLANHTKHITQMKKEVSNAATKDDMRKLTVQLKRFALYDDYKDLYEKTVPPVQNMEQISNVLVKEMEQFKEVIRGFDESLALKASKLDLHGVVQDLRRYTKVKTFEDYKFEM